MKEQLGEEIITNEIPPDFEDFPEDVQAAILVYNRLGDRIVGDIGYLGKDYTALDIHIEIANPDCKEVFLETILRLDERMIKQSAESMKREREKLKRK